MRKYAMIAAGGFWGAIIRFLIKSHEFSYSAYGIPINTLLINILGSFILGFFIVIAEDVLKFEEAEKLGVISGFLGAFTTFATVSKEINLQLMTGNVLAVAIYLVLSIVLGLFAIYIGTKTGDRLILILQESED